MDAIAARVVAFEAELREAKETDAALVKLCDALIRIYPDDDVPDDYHQTITENRERIARMEIMLQRVKALVAGE